MPTFNEYAVNGKSDANAAQTKTLYAIAENEQEAIALVVKDEYARGYGGWKVMDTLRKDVDGPARVRGIVSEAGPYP